MPVNSEQRSEIICYEISQKSSRKRMKSQTPAQCSITTRARPFTHDLSHHHKSRQSQITSSHLFTPHLTSHLSPHISTSHRLAPSTPHHHSRPHHCSLPSTAHCPRSLPSSLDLASASFSAALDAAQTPANQRELKSFRTHPRRGCALPIGRPPLSPNVSISGAKERKRRSGKEGAEGY